MPQEFPSSYISSAAALQRLDIPPQCEAGVHTNLTLFLGHAEIVAGADDASIDPVEMLRP